MTLNELRYIVAVARERHFGRAAEACFISQPTLSVAVKKLEEELGVVLFERRKGDVSVTAIGERIVAQAQRVMEDAAAVKQIARLGQDQLAGPLRLGAIYTVGPYLLPHLVAELRVMAPQMPLIIEENYTAVLAERLRRGELDAVLISLPFEEAGVSTMPLYKEPFVALLPSSHPLNQQSGPLAVGALRGEDVVLLGPGHCFRDQVLAACPDCGRRSNGDGVSVQPLEGGSLETIRYMVASGLGITVLPCSAAGADRFSERLVQIKRFETPPSRVVALAWRKSFPRPEAVGALREAILECQMSCVAPVIG